MLEINPSERERELEVVKRSECGGVLYAQENVVEKQIWKDEVSVEVSGSEGRIFNSIIVEMKEWS